MRSLALALSLAIVLAGCADDDARSFSCPEEYGTQYQDDYNRAWEQANETVREAMLDSDGDCMPDLFEKEIGTDPNNGTDYPSLEQLEAYVNGTADPGYAVFAGSGTIVVGTPGVGYSQGGGTFTVETGATLLFAEYTWDTPVVDLNGALASPSAGTTAGVANYDHVNQDGLPGQPDNPHSITLASPQTGDWSVTMFVNGATADTDYDYAVTVFYGAKAVPAGYSALS